MIKDYSVEYFDQFNKHRNILKQWVTGRVDRKGPVFSWLKKTLPTGSRLLDFGCGAGWFLRYAEEYFECVGIDSSKAALKSAKTVTKKTNLILGDEKVLSQLKADSIDVICVFDVLEHMHHHPALLQSFTRLLKDNGWLVVSVPNAGSVLHRILGKRWWAYADTSHVWLEKQAFWSNILVEAEFTVRKTFASGLINHPDTKYQLKGMVKLLHYFTQGWALWGGPLPNLLNDVLFFAVQKKRRII